MNSLDFFQSRIKEGNFLATELGELVINRSPFELLKSLDDTCPITSGGDIVMDAVYLGEPRRLYSSVVYRENADFEYCASLRIDHELDPQLPAYLGLKVLYEIFNGRTYNVQTAPENFLEERWKYKMDYTIGNIMVFSQKLDTPENPNEPYRTMAIIPVQLKYSPVEQAFVEKMDKAIAEQKEKEKTNE